MRSVSISIVAAVCSLILAASALAQTNQPVQQGGQQERQLHQEPYAHQLMEPDRFKGMKVRDAQGEEIGSVEQIVLDAMNGRIGYVVVSSGGFLGMGSEESIIPWSALQFHLSQEEESFLMVNLPQGRLLAAPHGDVQDMDRRYAELIHQYYGVAPYWQDPQGEGERMDQQQQPMAPEQQQPAEPQQKPAQQMR